MSQKIWKFTPWRAEAGLGTGIIFKQPGDSSENLIHISPFLQNISIQIGEGDNLKKSQHPNILNHVILQQM